jgi:hypothetical protein
VPNNGGNKYTTPRPTARDGAIPNRSNASDGVDDDDDDEAGAAPSSPPDPARGLTPAWALRYFNSETDVAELDHLAAQALAQLTVEERVTKDVERQMVEASIQAQLLNPAIAEAAAARLPCLTALFDNFMAAKRARLEDLQVSGALAVHARRLWQRVKALGENGRVEFTWQPRDPMLPPKTIHPARVRHVQVSFPGALWGGSNALDALAMRATSALTKPGAPPVWSDSLWLDGSQLPRVRIVPVATNPAGNPPGKPAEIALTPQAMRQLPRATDEQVHRCINALHESRPPGTYLNRDTLRDKAPVWLAREYQVYAPQTQLKDCLKDPQHAGKRRLIGSHS